MLSAFIHRRPLLRALLALVLFVGLLGTAAATHMGLTSAHAVAAAIDAVSDDLDSSDVGDTVSAEDDVQHDTLDLPDGLTVPSALLPQSLSVTAHAATPPWHASFELRPPIV